MQQKAWSSLNIDEDLFVKANTWLHIEQSMTFRKVLPEQWQTPWAQFVQSVVSLTSSLRVISLTVLADSIHNILIFFAEKM